MESDGYENSQQFHNERQALILKGEENGFVFYSGILYKEISSCKGLGSIKKYICFELDEYYGNNVLKHPKFGISTFPGIEGVDFGGLQFDTVNAIFAYPCITKVFDSIVNFFQDGKNTMQKYRFSYRVVRSEHHVMFATEDNDKITFSSSGRYFIGRLITVSEEENNDLYGVRTSML